MDVADLFSPATTTWFGDALGAPPLARLFAQRVGDSGQVILTDINGAMLTVGRDRMLDEGRLLPAVQCNAEALPFPARSFDCVSIAFGLRNVTRKDVALAGGASAAQQYLAAGFVDEMEISLAPVLLGSGERLFDGVGTNLHGLALVRTVAAPNITHLKFVRR